MHAPRTIRQTVACLRFVPLLALLVRAVEDHCARVIAKAGRYNFSPPGDGVTTSFGRDGFTAKLGSDFVDHWRKIE